MMPTTMMTSRIPIRNQKARSKALRRGGGAGGTRRSRAATECEPQDGVQFVVVNAVLLTEIETKRAVRSRRDSGIALIERGLVPPPEVDPRGFDRAMHRYDRTHSRSSGRHRRAGVVLMGIGFGLVMLISVAGGAMNEGIGVGGFFVIMGIAFFINGLFDHPADDYQPQRPSSSNGPITPESPRRD
jgi:hypothetical protein